MPVPSTIDDLSQTVGSNSPAGSETPTEGDNYIRSLSAFIAILRDKLDGTSDTGTITNAAFTGTHTGASSWSGTQTFTGGITVPTTNTGNCFSGEYTPALTAGTNVSGTPTANGTWTYSRVGNRVSVSGSLTTGTLTTAANTNTQIRIALPIISDFASGYDCVGTAGTTVGDIWQFVEADTTNNDALLSFAASTTSGHNYYLTFSYRVL